MRTSSSSLAIIVTAALFAGSGCAGMLPDATDQQLQERQQQQADHAVQTKAAEAQKLVQGSRYAEAVSAYRLILKEHPGTEWSPEAKYGIALIFASADNPQRDYAAAIAEFDEFLSLYPSDKRAAEAKSWRQALKTLLDTKKDNDRLNKNIEKLKQLDVRQEEKRLGK